MPAAALTDVHPAPLLLLDTHIWVRAFHDDLGRYRRDLAGLLDRAVADGRTRLAAISVWEVATLVANGRLAIRGTIDDWISSAIEAFGGRVHPLDTRVAVESTRLPALDHRDPADRFLISTARLIDASIVTADRAIIDYGRTGNVQVIDARR